MYHDALFHWLAACIITSQHPPVNYCPWCHCYHGLLWVVVQQFTYFKHLHSRQSLALAALTMMRQCPLLHISHLAVVPCIVNHLNCECDRVAWFAHTDIYTRYRHASSLNLYSIMQQNSLSHASTALLMASVLLYIERHLYKALCRAIVVWPYSA